MQPAHLTDRPRVFPAPVAVLPAVVLAALVLLYVVLLARLLPVGVDDLALAAVFSTDEALSGRIVRSMVADATLSPDHFFAYGALYHELAALAALPFWPAGGERSVLIALRAVSLAAGAATLLLTYALGARLFGAWTGLLAAALTACSTELALWSVTAHPDTLQVALLTGGLLAVCAVRDGPSRPRVALAAALAGLAFSTKYAGVLLLPVLGLALLAAYADAGYRGAALLRRATADALVAASAFGLVFAVTNPYALLEWRRWVTQVRAEMTHARVGHVTLADQQRLRWLGLVAARSFAGVGVVAMAVIGAAVALPRWLVAIWTFGYLAYLIAVVGLQEPRYALPVLPGLAVLAAGAAARLGAIHRRLGIVAAAMLVTVTAAGAVGPMRALYQERAGRMDAIDSDARVLAGRWLASRLASGAVVLSDAYVFLPPSVAGVTTFGLTEGEVAARRPVSIVVNEQIRGRFRDPQGGARAVDGPEAYTQRRTAYERLESGALGCYQPAADFGMVRIYTDPSAVAAGAQFGCGTPTTP
jgi:4-amino-4-deoxy-L-arabinose transferase-like glycosyltransferase